MLDNNSWTTPHAFNWIFQDRFRELVPGALYICIALLFLFLLIQFARCFFKREYHRLPYGPIFIWLALTGYYTALYFLFPYLHLINVRAVPQVHLFACIAAGVFIGGVLRSFGPVLPVFIVPFIIAGQLFWAGMHSATMAQWLTWNYTGWQSKEPFADLQRLYAAIRGGFSMPRVANELNAVNEAAGGIRLFEMLPYFANRATLEGVYLQSSVLGPATFLIQALISRQPSCPFSDYSCPALDIPGSISKVAELGVGSLILTSAEAIEQARRTPALQETAHAGVWHVFTLQYQPALAELFTKPPELLAGKEWRRSFYDWLNNFDQSRPRLVSDVGLEPAVRELIEDKDSSVWNGDRQCLPKLTVDFNRITLITDCPGKAHLLRVAYHPTWRSNHTEPVFFVSPGYLAIIPRERETVLTFGDSALWHSASIISVAAFVALCAAALFSYRKRFRSGLE